MNYNVKDTLFSQMGTKRIFDKHACDVHTYIDSKNHIAYIATFPSSIMAEDVLLLTVALIDENEDIIIYMDSIEVTVNSEIGRHFNIIEKPVYAYDEENKGLAFLEKLNMYDIISFNNSKYVYIGGDQFLNFNKELDKEYFNCTTQIQHAITIRFHEIFKNLKISDFTVMNVKHFEEDLNTNDHFRKGHCFIKRVEPIYDNSVYNITEEVHGIKGLVFKFITHYLWDGIDFIPMFEVSLNGDKVPGVYTLPRFPEEDEIDSIIQKYMNEHTIGHKCINWKTQGFDNTVTPCFVNGDLSFVVMVYHDSSNVQHPWIFNTRKPDLGFISVDVTQTADWVINNVKEVEIMEHEEENQK